MDRMGGALLILSVAKDGYNTKSRKVLSGLCSVSANKGYDIESTEEQSSLSSFLM